MTENIKIASKLDENLLNNKFYLLELAQLYEEIAEEFKNKNPMTHHKYTKKAEEMREKYNKAVEKNLKGVEQ